MSESIQSPRKVLAAQRRRQAVRMRIEGMTYAVIGKELGVSEVRAWKLVSEGLARLNEKMAEDAERLRRLSSEQIDLLLSAHLPKALAGDTKAAGVVLRALDSRAKLYGLIKTPTAQTATKEVSEEELRAEAVRLGLLPRELAAPTNGHTSNGAPSSVQTTHGGRF
jgi:hypothetical protein